MWSLAQKEKWLLSIWDRLCVCVRSAVSWCAALFHLSHTKREKKGPKTTRDDYQQLVKSRPLMASQHARLYFFSVIIESAEGKTTTTIISSLGKCRSRWNPAVEKDRGSLDTGRTSGHNTTATSIPGLRNTHQLEFHGARTQRATKKGHGISFPPLLLFNLHLYSTTPLHAVWKRCPGVTLASFSPPRRFVSTCVSIGPCTVLYTWIFLSPLHTISLFFFFSGVPDSLIHTVMSSSSFQDIFLPLSFSILPRAFKYYISPCERRIYQMSSLALFFYSNVARHLKERLSTAGRWFLWKKEGTPVMPP